MKDFRTLLRKTLLGGRSVNIAGLGYFYLSAQSKGTEKAEDFTDVYKRQTYANADALILKDSESNTLGKLLTPTFTVRNLPVQF